MMELRTAVMPSLIQMVMAYLIAKISVKGTMTMSMQTMMVPPMVAIHSSIRMAMALRIAMTSAPVQTTMSIPTMMALLMAATLS